MIRLRRVQASTSDRYVIRFIEKSDSIKCLAPTTQLPTTGYQLPASSRCRLGADWLTGGRVWRALLCQEIEIADRVLHLHLDRDR